MGIGKMRFAILALSTLVFFALPTPSEAQLGEAHFRAWDRQHTNATHSGRRTGRRVRTEKRLPATSKSIPSRYSPAVAQMLPHPSGCPARLFCACGAALKIFGTPRRDLWATSAWRRFPKAAPAPGMVAVNSRHIFVIDKVLGNGMVMAYDYNSGGNKSRYHMRSLAGYEVRNPRS